MGRVKENVSGAPKVYSSATSEAGAELNLMPAEQASRNLATQARKEASIF